ncbi:chemotaxis protein CheW [Pigmentibacter ruber]|uniref:chemotaxis protein CheW n=1 Tax=Pigmentibacter ruber TaxID=2683196 RepID=UPI00131ECF9C|nr:chemotaxis protein CheW [Pigmentibacter ruber]BFD31932.1 hypothetical protein GTC16762_15500 [Pigmentibacter ruber]
MLNLEKIQQMQIDKEMLVAEVNEQNLVRFLAFEKYYAVNIKNVKEIIEKIEFTPYPEKINYHLGIINVRGLVIPLIQLEKIKESKKKEYTKVIILEFSSEHLTAIQVDKISKCSINSPFILPGQTLNLNDTPAMYIDESNFDNLLKGNL